MFYKWSQSGRKFVPLRHIKVMGMNNDEVGSPISLTPNKTTWWCPLYGDRILEFFVSETENYSL